MKKLKKILLVNWLYFSKQLIEVGDVTFLTGKNGAGKSTVIDALQIVLLGETNSKNFNQAANEKSQRTLDGYLRADMDDTSAKSRRGKDFTSIIACEFFDEVKESHFVTGVAFDCRSDGTNIDHFFIYDGTIPENGFVVNHVALPYTNLRKMLKEQYGVHAEFYDTQKEYRQNMLSHWNVHSEQITRMMKKAVSFRPIVDIQKFITENICDIPDKPDIEAMQQNIRDYKRHEQLAERQEEKLKALQNISKLYSEMTQTIDRYKQQNFLVEWSKKEDIQSQIDKYTLDENECKDKSLKLKTGIDEISEKIERKERRKNELYTAYIQSDVYKEKDNLSNQKEILFQEQKRLLQQLQMQSMELRREADFFCELCQTISNWESEELVNSLIESADAIAKTYAVFKDCKEDVFSKSIHTFKHAQEITAQFYAVLRETAYKVENCISNLKNQEDEKKTALLNLQKNVKDYPKELLRLKEELTICLEKNTHTTVQIDILADVLEIPESEESWRRAVEGYLNTQKFYLLISPKYYREALHIYNQIKDKYGYSSFGLVDIEKLREHEHIVVQENSLAAKIETDNELARSYIDYLLGRVICCRNVDSLRNYKIAITPDGMLYQGYVARPIRKKWMDDAFIGRRAVSLRIAKIETELRDIESAIKLWNPIYSILSENKNRDPFLSKHVIQSVIEQRKQDYLRGQEISEELNQIDEKMSHLNLFWLGEQKKVIDELSEKITALRKEKENLGEEKGRLEERIQSYENEKLPELYQKLVAQEDKIQENFTTTFIENVGRPRYQQEFDRLKKASIIYKNFSDSLARTIKDQETATRKLFTARSEYATNFKPCSFAIESMDNNEYEEEQKILETSELPQYRAKIKAARESAMEQFQNDFLAKLKSSIDQVQDQVKSLNKALKQTQFGTDQYLFRVDRNPDYAEYYDMIMDPELMEGETGLFALPFQQKYGDLIESLFSRIAMSDDTQLNARRQSELQENIALYTDFRTYLKFDLETTDQNGSKQLLSKTLNMKSGGETQTPFYIAVLASFAQIYQVNNVSSMLNNTVRLVMFDEAFNKMDSERIVECVRLLRKMGLQAIVCTPPDKIADIMPLADCTLYVNKDKYKMNIIPSFKEI